MLDSNRKTRAYNAFTKLVEYLRERRTYVTVLSCFVVFITTYLLILPAVTLDQDEAERQGGIDLPAQTEQAEQVEPAEQIEPEEEAEPADFISHTGKGYEVTVENHNLPTGTELAVEEIQKKDADYDAYYEDALKAVQSDGLAFAKFYDISLVSQGEFIEPEDPLNVKISFDKGPEASDAEHVRIVHFAVDEETGKADAEVLDPEIVDTKIKSGKMKEASFAAESFSVYAIVYTVDFHWEVDGKKFDFSLPGGGYVSFEKLLEALGIVENSEEAKEFAADVETMEFSDPDLVWVGKADEDVTVGQIKDKHKLECEYSYRLTWDEIEQINDSVVKNGDWAIISLKAFQTEEKLTITMKDGREFIIKVTDYAEYTPVENDGVTIPNPSGTTMNLFDYWIDNSLKDRKGQSAWPGWDNNSYSQHNGQRLRGDGNNSGINSWSGNTSEGHALKFNPANDGTVIDGTKNNGRWDKVARNNDRYINSWVGNADPLQGLVEPTLNANGYPKLTNNSNLGTNGEDLDYLFDGTEGDSMGKKVYPGVDGLLYVDKDGYYTYDSRDFAATYNNGKFNLSAFTNESGGPRGFWPFGSEKFWLGLHMKVDFSMPANGKVLNPAGVYKDMEFSFSGDDDTWIYVDGILVGDGGGVHNRTQIDVNFRTGTVRVRGTEDPDYTGTMDTTTYLEDYYRAQNRFNSNEWMEVKDDQGNTVYRTVNGQQQPVLTFAGGTPHDLQMFYMERGGGFSNLMIHYNLVSTTDYSAHKSYHNSNGSTLNRNDYKFELIGFDNTEYASEGNEFVKAIMPDAITHDSSKPLGTFENPLWQTVPASGTTGAYRSLIIGNTEDGNVNFGDKEISSAYAGKQYKYVVREVVPDNAVNPDGVRWADTTEDIDIREEGGFVLNGITYDSRVYYFIGRVEEEPEGSGKYTLKKYRYLDPEYTIPDTKTKFFSFVNGEEKPVTLKVNKKSDTGSLLSGAVFSLTRAMEHHHDNKWVVREYKLNGVTRQSTPVTKTTEEGVLTFPNLVEGHYILEEKKAPAGYAMGDPHRWLLTLEKEDSTDEILLVPYITPLDEEGNPTGERIALDLPDSNNIFEYEVLNGPLPPIDLSLEKKWNDNGDTDVPDEAEAKFELHRIKTNAPVKVELLDSRGNKLSEVSAFVGDTIKIYDSGEKAFKHYIQTPGWIAVWFDNTREASDNVTPSDAGWTISTNNRYSIGLGGVDLDSSVSTSSGQYIVKQSDVQAGVVQLSLSTTYQGGTNNNRFDVPPTLYVSNSAGHAATEDETISTFTLKNSGGDGDAGNAWKKHFDDLDVVDENGNPYQYYFKEVSHSPEEYNIQTVEGNMGSSEEPLTTSGDVVVTNNTPEKPKITAVKEWKDADGNTITDETGLQGLEVKLTLFKGEDMATSEDTKDTITQTVTGNGEAAWLLKNENADVSNYTVRETVVKIPGGDFVNITTENPNPFGGTVTGDSTNGYTITNQLPTTEISVTKQWKDGTSVNADKVFDEAKTIQFTLYQKLGNSDGSVYTRENQPVTGTVTYTPASGGASASWSTESISDLPKYVYSDEAWHEATYYPVEAEIDDVTITYQLGNGNASETPSDAATSSGTVTIINTDIVVPITIVKVDENDNEIKLGGATFKLTKVQAIDSMNQVTEGKYEKTGTTSSEDATMGELKFEGLTPGYYYLEETDSPAGYIRTETGWHFQVNADGIIENVGDANNTGNFRFVTASSVTVANTPGAALPSSGGPGTTWIYLLGSLLLLGSGILLAARRRTEH